MIYRSTDIHKLLRRGDRIAFKDCAIFKRWWGREITLAQCLAEFRENNMIDEDKEIPLEEFEKWLRGLGWF